MASSSTAADEADPNPASFAGGADAQRIQAAAAQRMYRLELLIRDSPGIFLSDTELDRLNSRERAATEFLQRRHTPEGVSPPADSFKPWGADEQLLFVHRIRQVGADSRSQRELWARGSLSEEWPRPRRER